MLVKIINLPWKVPISRTLFWTEKWTYDNASDEGLAKFAHPVIYWWLCWELHRLDSCPKSRLPLIPHANSLTHLGPVWSMGLARLDVLFFSVNLHKFCVLRQIHAFLSPVPFVMMVAPGAYHLRLQNRPRDLNEQEVYSHHLRQVVVNELGTQIFLSVKANVTCLFGWVDLSRHFGWYVRLVKSKTICPIVVCRPKAGRVILSPFGSNSTVVPKFFICGSENNLGTLPVSGTSTLVGHGGFVGKMNSTTFPASLHLRVGKHKGLIARAKLRGNAIMHRMFVESSDCRSWSSWSCTTKIQNNVCWMVGQI